MKEQQQGSKPVPDPTELTTKQLLREIATTRELIEEKITSVSAVFETRLDAMDKAVRLLQQATDKNPEHIIDAFKRLQELHEEKFRSIEVQFAERDIRTEQTTQSSKVAVDAALQAAKEAVGEQNKSNALSISKSEAAFTKQIDQIGTLIQTTTNATNDKIDDIKERLTGIEGQSQGFAKSSDKQTSNAGLLMTAAVTVVVVLGGIISIIVFIATKG